MKFRLPPSVRTIADAVKALRNEYSDSELAFTPDGKFVGDLGEAIAAKAFNIELCAGKDIDGKAPDGRLVQVKSTGREKGGVHFRQTKFVDIDKVHLIAIYLDWENCTGEVIYNGPERLVRPNGAGQREATRATLYRHNSEIRPDERLKPDQTFVNKFGIS